MELFTFSRTDF